jgi:hypothetical protein
MQAPEETESCRSVVSNHGRVDGFRYASVLPSLQALRMPQMTRNPFICLKSGCDACVGTNYPCEFVCLECMRHVGDEWRAIEDHCDGCTAVTEMPKRECKFALEMTVAEC